MAYRLGGRKVPGAGSATNAAPRGHELSCERDVRKSLRGTAVRLPSAVPITFWFNLGSCIALQHLVTICEPQAIGLAHRKLLHQLRFKDRTSGQGIASGSAQQQTP
jgi:hypothetical protein